MTNGVKEPGRLAEDGDHMRKRPPCRSYCVCVLVFGSAGSMIGARSASNLRVRIHRNKASSPDRIYFSFKLWHFGNLTDIMSAELGERKDFSCASACSLQSEVDEYVLSFEYGPNKGSNIRVSHAEQDSDEELCRDGKSNRDFRSRSSDTEVCFVDCEVISQ